jgi:hypothetical protein
MLLAPNRRRTRRRTSSVKRGVSSEDLRSHIKLDSCKNAIQPQILILFHSRVEARKPAAELSENQCLGFLHQLKGVSSLGWRYSRLADYRSCLPCSREFLGLETIGTTGTAGTSGTGFFLLVFKTMEGVNPQVKQKILSDNPRRFYGI